MLAAKHCLVGYAPEKIQYGINRYVNETRRLYGVMESQLAKSSSGFVVGDRLTIADVAAWGWVASHGKISLIRLYFINPKTNTLRSLRRCLAGRVPAPRQVAAHAPPAAGLWKGPQRAGQAHGVWDGQVEFWGDGQAGGGVEGVDSEGHAGWCEEMREWCLCDAETVSLVAMKCIADMRNEIEISNAFFAASCVTCRGL